MADSSVAITAGAGTAIDTRTEATNGDHRQVVVIGDPSTTAGVAPVSGTNGLSVTLTTAIPAGSNVVGAVTQSGTWNVANISGTVSLPTGAATDASVTALQVAQASTTSGQSGPLVQGAVTTAAPTYTTAKTSPLSLTTAGALRVDASATTQPVSGTITANIGTSGSLALDATLTGGTQKTKLVDSAGTNVATVSAGGALKVDGSAATQPVSGTITANAGTGTFAISASALPLPSGAATSAKQPALGTAGTASTDVLTIQGIASMTAVKVDGSAVTQPVSGTVSITANSAVNVAQVNGVSPSMGNGVSGTGVQRVTIASDSTGVVGLAAGTNTVGGVNLVPATSGGLSVSRVISAASTNATSVKASAGQVFGWHITNVNAAARFVKLYNKASSPTVGTDTPIMTIAIPGNTAGAGAAISLPSGVAFGTGIALAITTGAADSDTGAVAASEVIANIFFK